MPEYRCEIVRVPHYDRYELHVFGTDTLGAFYLATDHEGNAVTHKVLSGERIFPLLTVSGPHMRPLMKALGAALVEGGFVERRPTELEEWLKQREREQFDLLKQLATEPRLCCGEVEEVK